jgi:anti-anti-sigma regulatory factor
MAMLLVTSNKSKQLLYLSFIGTVRPEEFQNRREELVAQLAGLSPGFHYLVDLTHLEFMGLDCMVELGRHMELIGKSGVGLLVRVIPDPSKDIGMNILTVFHYPHQLKVVTCQNLAEAVRALGLSD